MRSLRALLVDVPPAYGRILARSLEESGWRVRVEHADGPDELAAALQRRGWGAVLYGGDGSGRDRIPARKALAMVRLADPHLPFLAVSPYVHAGDLAAVVRGLDGAAAVVPDPAQLPRALRRALDATRLRRRVGGAHRFLLAQQAVTDHVAAGLEPAELLARVLATLGETLGWSCGAVWRPSEDGSELRCAATWHAANADAEVVALADASSRTVLAAGQGLPGRVWAFRRPAWVADVAANEPRAHTARRAGLMTATAFPIAIADHCAGVIEFFSHGITEPNPEVQAMFATVGGQLAQYLDRHTGAPVDSTRRWLDAAEAPLLALDAEGRVLLANDNACALAGRSEAELVGADWATAAVPEAERDAVRAALLGGVRAEHVVDGDRLVSWQLTLLSEGDRVLGTWATGTVREAPAAGSLEARLRKALIAGDLRLHYQPIFALGSGLLVALEALLRWDDPVLGPVSPADFIPVAETSGLIDAIGDWVLGAVCSQQAAWAARGMKPHISFNVSPSQLRRGDLVARMRERIMAPGVDPARLIVELTESSTLEDPALAEALVRELHALGLRIALDDFGTGYSSLSRLGELPVSTLKIDRAFLRDVPERPEAAAVVTAILQLAQALGRTAVAEGVETEAQLDFLERAGCPLAQGFLLGSPAAPDVIEGLMTPSRVGVLS
jgi:EAL domain-containing protein (putative c-di-GMP-specific phosphodiesterase class I)/PAS domain-containing protein